MSLDKVVWEYVRPIYERECGKRYRVVISSEGYLTVIILRDNDTVFQDTVRLVK